MLDGAHERLGQPAAAAADHRSHHLALCFVVPVCVSFASAFGAQIPSLTFLKEEPAHDVSALTREAWEAAAEEPHRGHIVDTSFRSDVPFTPNRDEDANATRSLQDLQPEPTELTDRANETDEQVRETRARDTEREKTNLLGRLKFQMRRSDSAPVS